MARAAQSVGDPFDIGSAQIVNAVETYVQRRLRNESTGHDWHHADRVRRTALAFAQTEDADLEVVELAALLHDVDDHKFSGSVTAGADTARYLLADLGARSQLREAVADIIGGMSFKGALVPDDVLAIEGRCVQDADRLDAIGAIGIGRCFAYGGFVARPLHDPAAPVTLHDDPLCYRNGSGTTITHFYEKLLLVRDRMTTSAGRALAEKRHAFLVTFLDEFLAEWAGNA